MKTATLSLAIVLALVCSGVRAANVYMIDIDSTTSGGGLGLQTEPGWTSLDATQPSENDSVTVDGVVFKVTSTDGSRLRTSGGSPNPNALTGDFVFDDGANQAVILQFGGPGDLQAGIWDVDLYSNDTPAQPGNQFVGYRTNTTETIVGNAVTPKAADPAITFQFESDGTSAYDVFVRERGNDRSRLNAVQLTHLSALTPATDTVLKYDLDDGASDVSATATTSQTDGVDVLAAGLSATDITSGPGWGREDPANGNNANVGNGSGPESQTDDNNTWWARGSTLPDTPDSTHYASFTVTPDTGYGLDLSDGVLGVKMGATDRNQAGVLEFNVALRSSADGFASDLDVASTVADQNTDDPLYVTSYLDLSALGTVTDPLEFRMYFDDNSGSGATHPLLDTVSVLGTVVPPTVLAYYVDGTDIDAAALTDLADAAGVTAGNLASVGFESDITRTSWGGAGSTPAGPTAGSSAGSEWLLARANLVQGTPGTNTDYFSFTVTADGDGRLDLVDLTFDWAVATNQDGGGIISNYEVFASADGGAFTSVGSGGPISLTTNPTFLRPAVTEWLDLTGLPAATSYEFRIALGDNSGANSKSTWVQGIQLRGEILIPEPVTMLLAAMGISAIGAYARKRRRKA